MKLYIADAFTEELFGGNPAGVVLIPSNEDFPSEDTMLKVAAELRYSETAFVKDLGNNEFQLRYFTPAMEVDLCGHATIASFYCLNTGGFIHANPTSKKESDAATIECVAHTKAGKLNISVSPDQIMMEMGSPKLIYTITDYIEVDRLYEISGTEFDQSLGLQPMIISTGLPDIMLPVGSRNELNSLNPNFDLMTKLSEQYGVTGVHAFAFENGEIFARNFAPICLIDEEAATGTANGALTYYLFLNKKIDSKSKCKILQGEAMGRPSVILTSIDAESSNENAACTIKVGGRAAILAEGELFI